MGKGFFIASTGQNVGKTTTCLGLLAGLKKRYERVAFMKPVGQQHVETESGTRVDKDVLLVKEHFGLLDPSEEMSPVLIDRGFTKAFLDGRVHETQMMDRIAHCYQQLASHSDAIVLEGTGHMGVGSIVNANNAQVAARLQLPILLVVSAGIGSSFDQVSLNLALCEKHGTRISGIILNRVLPEKREMILEYFTKALKRWQIPIVGCVPLDPFLSSPLMKDFEQLFQTSLFSGETHRLRHFKQMLLVATSAEGYREALGPYQLIITPATREDIIEATIAKAKPGVGLILTGDHPPRDPIIAALKRADIPALFTQAEGYTAMEKILSHTAKIRREDLAKIREAIHLVETHLHFDRLQSIC